MRLKTGIEIFREMKPSEAAGKERREQRQDLYVQMREEIRSA